MLINNKYSLDKYCIKLIKLSINIISEFKINIYC